MFNQLTKIGKQLGGDLNKALQLPSRGETWRIGSKAHGHQLDADTILTPASLVGEHDEEKEAILQGLEKAYYQQDFDPMLYELSTLPAAFNTENLEELAIERTAVLEVVSELLSRHVLLNHDKLAQGVTEISLVEDDLQAAYIGSKAAREFLALVRTDVQTNIKVAKQTKRKQAYVRLLGELLELQQVHTLHIALRAAQDNGNFAEAFHLCSQCTAYMQTVEQLHVTYQLSETVHALQHDTSIRLHNALQAACTDFKAEHYGKILQGFMYLGSVDDLGQEVASAFTNSVNTTVVQVVQGMLLTRPGFEDRVKGIGNMQEMLKWLPSDLFRTCLARVFMVIFDIMHSHFSMTQWHEAGLKQHRADLASIQTAKAACKQRMLQQELAIQFLGSPTASPMQQASTTHQKYTQPSTPEQQQVQHTPATATSMTGDTGSQLQGRPDTATVLPFGSPEMRVPSGGMEAAPTTASVQKGASELSGSMQRQRVPPTHMVPAQRDFMGTSPSCEVSAARPTVRFENEASSSPQSPVLSGGLTRPWQRPHGIHAAHQAPRLSGMHASGDKVEDPMQQKRAELQALEVREHDEMEWGEVLHSAHSGLTASRRLLWDEAERKIIALLSSSSAFEGDHFLQVLEWAQKILSAGEAFSGVECVSLRSMLTAQSSNFFSVYHSSNLEALHSMLEKELWRRLPALADGGMVSLHHALRNPSWGGSLNVHACASVGEKPFEVIAARGNPWRQRRHRSKREHANGAAGTFRLGFAGSSMLDEDRASRRLEVDDNGLPRQMSSDIWSPNTSRGPSRPASARGSSAPSRRESHDTELASTSGHHILSESEASELFGDFIDEDSQTVQREVDVGGVGTDSFNMTISSRKLMHWLRDYGELMRVLRPAPFVYQGMCQLFEMFFMTVFNTFSEVSVADLMKEQTPMGIADDAVSNRLRKTLTRMVNQSLIQYKGSIMANRSGSTAGASAASLSSVRGLMAASFTSGQPPNLGDVTTASGASGQATAVSNSGNMWGLLERTVAVEALASVALELKKSKADLQSLLPASEYSALETFFARTVEASEDVYDAVLRAGSRLNLPIQSIAERVAGHKWDLPQAPPKASPWVNELCTHLQIFRERLSQAKTLSDAHLAQLWMHAIRYVAEVVLEGISNIKGRCSAIGRNAMSSDFAEVVKAIRALAPRASEIAVSMDSNESLVNNYIQAFFVTSPDGLQHWVQTHPEYTKGQLTMLASTIADFKGLKKKDRQILLDLVENSILS